MDAENRGGFVWEDAELWYVINDVHAMDDFFLTLPGRGDVWAFLWSQGGITAGRESAEQAIFPYYTADKISDMKYSTGPVSIIRMDDRLWYPLDPTRRETYSIAMTRNMSKIRFAEKNEELGLTYELTWQTSERFGLVKQVSIVSEGRESFSLLDGARNVLPASVTTQFQSDNSILLDAYKKTDLDTVSGVAVFAVSSIVTDKAEPNEALYCNVSYFSKEGRLSVSPSAPDDFSRGREIDRRETARGVRGSVYFQTDVELAAGERWSHYQVFDTRYDGCRLEGLRTKLLNTSRTMLETEIRDDIAKGSAELDDILKSADGIEDTGDLMASVHHEANVLFNVMRGGTFLTDRISLDDYLAFAAVRSKRLYKELCARLGVSSGRNLAYREMKALVVFDADSKRLFFEYLPLSFSRRHGDPSRPWNKFLIKLRNDAGRPILNYEGNWRDIFQNWEALSTSYPGYLEHMVSRFLDSMTVDGYNPYRLNRDGFDWEVPEPDNPWAQIGYWNDHQVVYLERLLVLLKNFGNSDMFLKLGEERFTTAHVPYRLKNYEQMLQDPHDTIDFDYELDSTIGTLCERLGTDGKLLLDASEHPVLVSFTAKMLQILVAKLASLVPDGGIWMNTQRPEWNDANNALAGFGLSLVSLAAVRSLLSFLTELYRSSKETTFLVPMAVKTAFLRMSRIYGDAPDGFNDVFRFGFVSSLGLMFEDERRTLYAEGFDASVPIERDELLEAFPRFLRVVDATIASNKRDDGLYHSYNILDIGQGRMSIEHLKLMLEGQVAVLSSGVVSPDEAVGLLSALRRSDLKEPLTGAYTLYPDERLPLFWEKNRIGGVSDELKYMKDRTGRPLLSVDCNGMYHFSAECRNARSMTELLGHQDEAAEALYEMTFAHRFFTGRSGSFFAYEGLGSVYWHMVSKLLLAVQELALAADNPEVRATLVEDYFAIRASLGYKRSATAYGSFPFLPYSHTPKGRGAQQPGMTGQVKEEILSRWGELGVLLEDGVVAIRPVLLERSEFRVDGTLLFTRFSVPFTYILSDGEAVELSVNGGEFKQRCRLSKAESKELFSRSGQITSIQVRIPVSQVLERNAI